MTRTKELAAHKARMRIGFSSLAAVCRLPQLGGEYKSNQAKHAFAMSSWVIGA
jgi:hypothetical protein